MVKLTPQIACAKAWATSWPKALRAARRPFGHPEISMTVKGQAIPAYDPRGMKGMGIAYATSNRGACHLRAYTPAAELGVMPFGSLKVDPLAWKGKGELTKIFQDVHAVSDSLDLCKFSAFAQGMRNTPSSSTASPVWTTRWKNCSSAASASTTWSATTTTWPASAKARTTCPSASRTSQHHARLRRPRLRTRPDAGRVLQRPRLGERRRAGANPTNQVSDRNLVCVLNGAIRAGAHHRKSGQV
jgi:hypothetical protein